ncbi:MAG: purine-nucleoside phosphorylase [Planctomycetes bacterium]|nr:purine-nucleoside phosphorylase [Planctomycetota bacterium]MCL4731540.1 purine-nucleoside phosphorylase [Planctomycetota bacterium]
MSETAAKMHEAASAVRVHTRLQARVGIVLGTGLGALGKEVEAETRIAYSQIPHMGKTSVQSHSGELVAGRLGKTPVFVLEGRLHFYEGHSLEDIVFPVRLLKALGCDTVILSNAAGGLNPKWKLGDIMVLDDHINLPGLAGVSPLLGPNDDALGPRFPDMSAPYDPALIKKAVTAARKQKLQLRRGVYVMVTGPNLETRAEYRMLRNLGADVVGMSTVPEVIAARHLGMKVAAFSIVTDMCIPDELEEANIEKIIATANKAEPRLTRLVKALVASL